MFIQSVGQSVKMIYVACCCMQIFRDEGIETVSQRTVGRRKELHNLRVLPTDVTVSIMWWVERVAVMTEG